MPVSKGTFFNRSVIDFREGSANTFESIEYAFPLYLKKDNANTLSSTVNRLPRGFWGCIGIWDSIKICVN